MLTLAPSDLLCRYPRNFTFCKEPTCKGAAADGIRVAQRSAAAAHGEVCIRLTAERPRSERRRAANAGGDCPAERVHGGFGAQHHQQIRQFAAHLPNDASLIRPEAQLLRGLCRDRVYTCIMNTQQDSRQ